MLSLRGSFPIRESVDSPANDEKKTFFSPKIHGTNTRFPELCPPKLSDLAKLAPIELLSSSMKRRSGLSSGVHHAKTVMRKLSVRTSTTLEIITSPMISKRPKSPSESLFPRHDPVDTSESRLAFVPTVVRKSTAPPVSVAPSIPKRLVIPRQLSPPEPLLDPALRRRHWLEKRLLRMQQVQESRKHLDDEFRRKSELAMKKEAIQRVRAANKERAKRLIGFVILGAFLQGLFEYATSKVQKEIAHRKLALAKMRIAHWTISRWKSLRTDKKSGAKDLISRCVVVYMSKKNMESRNNAAKILRESLKAMGQASRQRRILQKYRRLLKASKIITVACKRFMTMMKGRERFLYLMWIRLEDAIVRHRSDTLAKECRAGLVTFKHCEDSLVKQTVKFYSTVTDGPRMRREPLLMKPKLLKTVGYSVDDWISYIPHLPTVVAKKIIHDRLWNDRRNYIIRKRENAKIRHLTLRPILLERHKRVEEQREAHRGPMSLFVPDESKLPPIPILIEPFSWLLSKEVITILIHESRECLEETIEGTYERR